MFSKLRIFDEFFDVINGEPFLTLYKTSAIIVFLLKKLLVTFEQPLKTQKITSVKALANIATTVLA